MTPKHLHLPWLFWDTHPIVGIKARGFTLIEVSVAVLIASILLHGIFNLLFVTMNRFSRQEESLTCISEASLISAHLRQDFEACSATKQATSPLSMAQEAVSFQDEKLTFRIIQGSQEVPIRYVFDSGNRQITREMNNQIIKLGEGHVSHFVAVIQILCGDGFIRSYPLDPGSQEANPPVASSTIPLRTWVKIILTLEGKIQTKPEVRQTYVFRIFPVGLNRALQSIWNKF